MIRRSSPSQPPLHPATSACSHIASRPHVLKFKSEFELKHGANPVGEADIVVCMDEAHLEQRLQVDLEKQYEAKPVIVLVDKDQ